MAGDTTTSSECPEELSLNEEEEDCLLTNRVLLSKNVRLVPELWTYLRQNRLTGFMEHKIKLSRTEYEQVGGLLDFLAKRSLRDLNDFRDALVATCQRHVVESCLTVSSSSSDAVQKSLWKEHQVVLEDMIRPTDALLNATTARQIIDHSQKDDILGTTDAKEKIHKVLEYLAINGATDLTLHEALREADQHDVVDFLTGTCALMTTEQKNSLKRKVLAEAISLDSRMIQCLIERRIVNKSEKDVILKQSSKLERVRCLLDIIAQCSRSTYDVFVQALSSTGQHVAVSILKPGQVKPIDVMGPFKGHQKEFGKYLRQIQLGVSDAKKARLSITCPGVSVQITHASNIDDTVNNPSTGWNQVPKKEQKELVSKATNTQSSFDCKCHAQNGSSVQGGQEVNKQNSVITNREPNSDEAIARNAFKGNLTKNRVKLTESIDPNDLWDHLRSDGVILKSKVERIKKNATEKEQVGKILDHFEPRPFTDHVDFCMALIKTNQGHVVRELLWEKKWTTLIDEECQATIRQVYNGQS